MASTPCITYRHEGMALVAVLWLVAALSIIVTGISSAVRNEIRLVSAAQQSVKAQALGAAAIHLALQQMAAKKEPVVRLTKMQTAYRDTAITVTVTPLTGLIDLNMAPAPLLAALFSVAGQLDSASAVQLAQAVVDGRTRKDELGADQGFEATDDLLHIPGFSYPLYAKIFGLVTAEQRGSGRVNPLAAPIGVLVVLADGNVPVANKAASDRDAGQVGVDTTRLNAEYIDTGSTQRFLLEARVPSSDGTWSLITKSVDLTGGRREGFPWRTFRSEYRVEATAGKNK